MRANLFIAGVPKAGTTSLYQYLRGHPDVFMAYPKEPGFFADDLAGLLRPVACRNDYDALFHHAGRHHRIYGEATAIYLYSESALGNVCQYNPDARIIISLRNPVDAVGSWHAHLRRYDYEPEADLETAWRLQESRLRGEGIPTTCHCAALLQYRRVYAYAEQLKRVYSLFGKNRVHLVIFDDLMDDPARVYSEILQFLDVPHDGRSTFDVLNEHRSVRVQWLSRLLNNPPRLLARGVERFKSRTGIRSLGLSALGRRIALRTGQRPALRPDFRRELCEAFRAEIQQVSTYTNRDLQHWISPENSPSASRRQRQPTVEASCADAMPVLPNQPSTTEAMHNETE